VKICGIHTLVIPWTTVEQAEVPGGGGWELARRGAEWAIRAGGRVLMSSRLHGSEEALARAALARVRRPRAVLVGGLGMGFTLRAALDALGPEARVTVAELVPALVAWNRGPLAPLAGRPLADARVEVVEGDALSILGRRREAFDAVLLDVDNGPAGRGGVVGRAENATLYVSAGVQTCAAALRPGGVLAVWSAGPAAAYLRELRRAGLDPAEESAAARGARGGARHAILIGVLPGTSRARAEE
jgi:spermidine synthase